VLSQVELLKKYNLRVRGHLGQHLLMDPNTIRKIADGLLLEPGEPVFEIGPGLGAMTVELLTRGHPVLAVEKDPKFVEVLNAEVSPAFPGQLEVIHKDILECDLTKLMGTGSVFLKGVRHHFVKTKMEPDPGKTVPVPFKIKVIGNLPYYISTPILFHLIEHRALFRMAVFMIQKEVAARMTARAGEDDYGRLTVSSGVFGKTETLFDVSPKCFLPAPEVTSRVVRYTFHEDFKVKDEAFLLDLVRIAFAQRRKILLPLLLKGLKKKKDRAELEGIFLKLGFLPTVRGEELSRDDFIALAEALR
jgi:16S rRNA (adenine1518-N6/adenine1519-N6)-dimethyltransferase